MEEPGNASNESTAVKCNVCFGEHCTYNCATFLLLNVRDRAKVVKSRLICKNCLSRHSVAYNCAAVMKCDECGMNHSTRLHVYDRPGVTLPDRPSQDPGEPEVFIMDL
jgi:hypothetical protein